MTEVARIDSMAANAEQGEEWREAVHEGQQDLDGDDTVDDAREKLLCEDGMFLDKLRKVVQSRG